MLNNNEWIETQYQAQVVTVYMHMKDYYRILALTTRLVL